MISISLDADLFYVKRLWTTKLQMFCGSIQKSTLLFLCMLNLALDLNLDFETFFDHDFSANLGARNSMG